MPSARAPCRPVTTTLRGGLTIEPSLAWLLQPLPVQTFLDEIWAQQHHHVKRSSADYFDSLLPGPSASAHLLELFRREPSAIRLVREKDKKSSENYRLGDGGLDLARIRDDFADGYTIVVEGVERYARAVGLLARAVEVELNFPTQVNAYISPPGSRGLVPHFDQHDVVVLQIEGSKIWHLYDGAHSAPPDPGRYGQAVPTDSLAAPTDVRLEAGDVLYLPRGRVHAADTTADSSVHLTIGVHAPSVVMLAIGALHARSFADDRLNARLPPRHLDDPEVQASLGALLRDTVRTVEDPTAVAAGLDSLAEILVRRGQCPPIGPISNAAAIDGHTLVRKYQPLYSRVKEDADGVALQFATLSIAARPDHKAALMFISTSTEPFRVSDLPELAAAQQIELVRSLIVSGFLVRLPSD